MSVIVRIPTPMRTLTAGAEEVSMEGPPGGAKTVAELLALLDTKHAGMRERLLDDKGVRKFVNIYVGDEDIRFLEGLATTLKDGDQISIVPAIAGG